MASSDSRSNASSQHDLDLDLGDQDMSDGMTQDALLQPLDINNPSNPSNEEEQHSICSERSGNSLLTVQ